jgi:5'-3' exonuclease
VIVLVDGNNLAMRAFHAAKGSMSWAGMDTGALQIFVTTLAHHVRQLQPTHLVVCWDTGISEFRTKLYPSYKAARHAQGAEEHGELFVLIKEFLTWSNIAQWAQSGYEADDLIAAGWRHHHLTDKITILSADKDLLQLLDANTVQRRFVSGNKDGEVWDVARFVHEFGYRPTQLPMVMALMGDTSDGIPGVKGVGPKTAVKKLAANDWDLERTIQTCWPDHRVVITTSRALADLSWIDAPVPDVAVFTPTQSECDRDWPNLLHFCERYQLRTIRQRLISADLWH